MKQIFTIALLALSAIPAIAQHSCETATPVMPGSYNVALQPGSEAPTTICTSGTNNDLSRGAWYSYTPTELHTTTVSTAVSGLDTRLHIYTGSCGNLSCVAGDDDSGPGWSSVASFTAEAGITYYIVFDDNWDVYNFTFELTEAPFVPQMFTMQSLPATNGYADCIVDMNGDYLDDVVFPTGNAVNIHYQAANDSGFTAASLTTPGTNFTPDWSMAAGDYNKDGYNDLLYGNGGGAVVMLSNSTGTAFSTKLETTQFVFSQRTNFSDINADGNLDAFICHDIQPNVYFLNNGSGGGTFHQGGLGDYVEGGNYGSIWVDYDNDGDSDMFIAKCRGGSNPAAIDELHRNNGDGTFTNVAQQAGLADMHQSWSAAWADFDNDGDMDVMIGNSAGAFGNADPNDPLNSHKLMRNNGDGTFTNVTVGSGYDTFTTPNLEHVAHDFDNDGYVDVLGGGNTIMMNNGDMTFTPRNFIGQSGPIGDLNNDGFLDIQNGTMLYMNNANDNNWIKIHLQGIESNRNGIGARVEVYTTTEGLEKQIRDIRSGDGFRYMSSLNAHFGLGQAETIEKVVVKWPSGTVDTIMNPGVNTPLLVVEGEHVLSTAGFNTNAFALYPNPAKTHLNINSNNGVQFASAAIYDLSGRLVKNASLESNRISVQSLETGTYIITLKDASGNQYSRKFIKE